MSNCKRFLRISSAAVFLSLSCSPIPLLAQADTVATIGQRPVLMPELDARISAKLEAQQAAYDLQLRQLELNHKRARAAYRESELNALLDERALELEASRRKTTSQALLDAIKVPATTDSDARAFYDAQKAQLGQPYENLEARIKNHLDTQAKDAATRKYLDSLRSKFQAVVTLEPEREAVDANGPERGPATAPVTIVEFSDFQCPYCARFELVLKTVMAKYPGKVRLVYRHLPLSQIHPDAEKAAEAAICAGNQGRFWELHDLMFQDQGFLGADALKDKAKTLSLDVPVFDECLDSGRALEALKYDEQAAEQLALSTTPTSFVNGRIFRGVMTEERLSSVIEDELRRAPLGAVGKQTAVPRAKAPPPG
ncbi:MAG: DsbA family protein [Steroidobacteraceae bacterium]|jgi:protein-disulfide isomerase